MNSAPLSRPAIAVLSPFMNFRDLRRRLAALGLDAHHVVRPSYRESLRWLQDKMTELQYKVGVMPLLFMYENGEAALTHDAPSAAAAMEKMLAATSTVKKR